jgi:prepilin-type N-terminal cleavage/methylation domain-containing protein
MQFVQPSARPQSRLNGFTLVEMSIVLVVIALVVGGIFLGRELIQGARIRATVKQIEQIGSAVNTFRMRYNGYPGDLANATVFGLPVAGPSAYPVIFQRAALGNGLIESCVKEGGGDAGAFGCENKFFWNHLYLTGLIG